ncbi:MAG: DUF4397 domain-containing protein [Chloroflexi bacterium]|nr:DUF4397 domain-containing protein [Chloroflexota bacterium]
MGDGVKVMVNDTGIDFGHPDLVGTQARIDDAASPYNGWPEQFDSRSMYLLARDHYLGETNIEDGQAWYISTAVSITTASAAYKPIGANTAHNYTLPGASKSGVYHIGSHPDQSLAALAHALNPSLPNGERAAVLVVDEHTAGVYDTVYVDLNYDLDFSNDKALRKGDEIANLDLDGDGYADISGGLIYFIADGAHPLPASDWFWGLPAPAKASLVAFTIVDTVADPGAGNHGQLCASEIAAQGIVNGGAPAWKPPYAGNGTGLSLGASPHAKLVANGDYYRSFFEEDGPLFAALGYDGTPNTSDDIQIITNSWGGSAVHNDGWDSAVSRLYDLIQRKINPSLSILKSAGNGAAGYGTVTDAPPSGITVGASTSYGSSTSFETIDSLDQINYGDVQSWSGRGPNARGYPGIDILANGAWGYGLATLNEIADGWNSTELWGGTSKSSPQAAGNLALLYQAYKTAHGSWPTYSVAKAIFKSSADPNGHDAVTQGPGVVNASRAVAVAAGGNFSQWRVVHASPGAPAVDIMVDGALVLEHVAFGAISAYMTVPAGAHHVQVYAAGATSPALIDTTLTTAAGQAYTIAAAGLPTALEAVVAMDFNRSGDATMARVRLAHLSPGAPAVDVQVSGGGAVLFSNVGFKQFTDYVSLPAGSYSLDIKLAGSGTLVDTIPGVAVSGGKTYTFYAIGIPGGAPPLQVKVTVDAYASFGGAYVTPDQWSAGDYRGIKAYGFANIMLPGATSTQTFTLHNSATSPVTATLTTQALVRIGTKDVIFDTVLANESSYNSTKPDYLANITNAIPPGTDLIDVQSILPWDKFDYNNDYNTDAGWRIMVYDWKDLNGDGKLWTDTNSNGTVNNGEIQTGEYNRYGYGYDTGTSDDQRVHGPFNGPNKRQHDGIFVGLLHRTRNNNVTSTSVRVRVTFYQLRPISWVSLSQNSISVPAGATASFDGSVHVPAGTAMGLYQGHIVATYADGTKSAIPLTINVAANTTDFSFGGPNGSLDPYNNGTVSGFFDWAWRNEAGDWRFYFADLPDSTPDNTNLLIDTRWNDRRTDIDTLLYGPVHDSFSNGGSVAGVSQNFPGEPSYYGPYSLGYKGGSADRYIGSGKYRWSTKTGGPREFVAAPATPGLNLLMLHNVLFGGSDFVENFTGRVGTIQVNPAPITIVTDKDSGSVSVTVKSSLQLDDLVADAYGLGRPDKYTAQAIHQDDPNDTSTASYRKTVTLQHASRLVIDTGDCTCTDIDLYILYDANNDGQFNFNSEVIGASTSSTDQEHVQISFPPDGKYLIAVHGWNVPAGNATFSLTVNAVEGHDLSVTSIPAGPFSQNQTITFKLNYNRTMAPGEIWNGDLVLGPSFAPSTLFVPVQVVRVAPETVKASPANNGYVDSAAPFTNFLGGRPMYTGEDGRIAPPVGMGFVRHGVFQFDLSSIPTDADVLQATVDLTGLTETGFRAGTEGLFNLRLLDSSVDAGWTNWGFWPIHNAPAAATLSPVLTIPALQAGTVNTFTFTQDQLQIIKARLGGSKKLSFRLDGNLRNQRDFFNFGWDGGNKSNGPVLHITYGTP